MSGEVEVETKEQVSSSDPLQEILDNPPANSEEFMARLKESGYELKPIEQQRESFLPPQPKMVVIRLDAAKNALKGQPHE